MVTCTKIAPVIVGPDSYVARQEIAVDLRGLLFHTFENVLRLLAGEHEDDAFDPVVIVLETEFSEARSVADGDLADVADVHRHAVVVPHDDVADVFGFGHQPKPAHVEELRALRVKAAAGVGIVGGQGVQHLRQRNVITVNLGRIEQHLVLHHRAAEA
jgi:hypothetical protein